MKKFKIIFITVFLSLSYITQSYSKPVPESFADLAEKLSPSVVNISTTTVVEQKSREMPSFPPGSPFEEFFKQVSRLYKSRYKYFR